MLLEAFQRGEMVDHPLALAVSKAKIAASGDFNLTGERYRESKVHYSAFPMVKLGEICEIGSSKRVFESEWQTSGVPFYRAREIVKLANHGFVENELFISEEMFRDYSMKYGSPKEGDLMITGVGTLGICYLVKKGDRFYFKDGNIIWLKNFKENINSKFVKHLFASSFVIDQIQASATGGTVGTYTITNANNTQIPLPPLEVQNAIVAEIEQWQKVIDGAKQVIAHYRPTISIDPNWEMVILPEISENCDNKRKPVTKSDRLIGEYPYYGASGIVDYVEDYIFDGDYLLISEDGANLLARNTPIAFSISGKTWVNNHAHILKFKNKATQIFVETYINQIDISNFITGMAQPKLNQQALNTIEIPLPSLEEQNAIVAEIEKERAAVDACKQLIAQFEAKIKAKIATIWGENTSE
jgi:restriction endonuclease S subunit